MHERNALTKRRVKHGFALFHFHLDASRLEPNLVNLRFRHAFGLVAVVTEIAGASCRSRAKGRRSGPFRLSCSVAGIDLEALAIFSHCDLTLGRRERPEPAERAAKRMSTHVIERPHILGVKAQMRLGDEGLAV